MKLTRQIKDKIIEAMMSPAQDDIDLRTCNMGDILISSRGSIMFYVSPTEENNYYDHIVEYLQDVGRGTRTHDGHVFRKNRKEEDHNIVRIIHLNR